MPTVRAILSEKHPDVASVDSRATVLDAARIMAERRVGAVVVLRRSSVVGIFTERDVLNRVVAQQKDPASTVVEDVMTSPVACCGPDSTRAECRAFMRSRGVRHLPVVEEGRLLGMISIRDILEDVAAEQEQTIQHLYEYMYGEVR
jgi:CBS domain-containing protein